MSAQVSWCLLSSLSRWPLEKEEASDSVSIITPAVYCLYECAHDWICQLQVCWSGLAQTPVTHADLTWQWTQVGAIFPPHHAAFSPVDGWSLTWLSWGTFPLICLLWGFLLLSLAGSLLFHWECESLAWKVFLKAKLRTKICNYFEKTAICNLVLCVFDTVQSAMTFSGLNSHNERRYHISCIKACGLTFLPL